MPIIQAISIENLITNQIINLGSSNYSSGNNLIQTSEEIVLIKCPGVYQVTAGLTITPGQTGTRFSFFAQTIETGIIPSSYLTFDASENFSFGLQYDFIIATNTPNLNFSFFALSDPRLESLFRVNQIGATFLRLDV